MLSFFGLRDESLRAAGRILLARETQADLILPCTFRTLVDDNQQYQHRNENKGGQRTQLRCQSAFARIGVDVGGERFQSFVSNGEYGYCEVVDRERKGKDEAAYHTRKYLRKNYLAQCLKGSGAEVEGGFVHVLVHLLQAGHYAQHYVRGAECDVRQYHGCESLRDTATDEQQEQRHARNDVRIHHRNGIGEVHYPARACAQVEDADGRDAAQRRTGGGCQHGNGKGVPDGARQRVVHAAREEGAVQLGGESRPVAQHFGFGEGEYHDDKDRRVQQRKQQPQIAFGKNIKEAALCRIWGLVFY